MVSNVLISHDITARKPRIDDWELAGAFHYLRSSPFVEIGRRSPRVALDPTKPIC